MPPVKQEHDESGEYEAQPTLPNGASTQRPATGTPAPERNSVYHSHPAPVYTLHQHHAPASDNFAPNDPRAKWSAQEYNMARQKAMSELPTFVNHFKRSFDPPPASPIGHNSDAYEPPYKRPCLQDNGSFAGRKQPDTALLGSKSPSNETPWDAFLYQAAAAASDDNTTAASGDTASSQNSAVRREPLKRPASGDSPMSSLGDPLSAIDNLHGLEFDSFEAALAYAIQRVPILSVQGDDHDAVTRNPKAWVLRLKSGFAVPPKPKPDTIPIEFEYEGAQRWWGDWQHRAQFEVIKRLGTDKSIASKRLEGSMWQLLSEVLAMHRSGAQRTQLGLEQGLKCTDRLEQMIIGIAECAKIRADVLIEAHHREIAAAPQAYYKRKLINLWANYGRKLAVENSRAQQAAARTGTRTTTSINTNRIRPPEPQEAANANQRIIHDGRVLVRENEPQVHNNDLMQHSSRPILPREAHQTTGDCVTSILQAELDGS